MTVVFKRSKKQMDMDSRHYHIVQCVGEMSTGRKMRVGLSPRDNGIMITILARSHTGILTAERKNRLERTHLDQKLKVLDRDSARKGFLVERQQRSIVNKWQVVSLTTGHSSRALPPDGPHDDVYNKSKYSRQRLNERRLREWKSEERELEVFLRQHDARPNTSPCWAGRYSSLAVVKASPLMGKSSGHDTLPSLTPRWDLKCPARPAQDCGVIVSSQEEGNGMEEEEYELKTGDKQSKYNFAESGSKTQPTPRRDIPDLQKTKAATPKTTKNVSISEGPMTDRSNLKGTVSQTLLKTAQNYNAYARACSVPGAKFYVAKDRVVMDDSVQHSEHHQGNKGGTNFLPSALDTETARNREASVCHPWSGAVERSAGFESNDDGGHLEGFPNRPDSVGCKAGQTMDCKAEVGYENDRRTAGKQNLPELLKHVPGDKLDDHTSTRNPAKGEKPAEECENGNPRCLSRTGLIKNATGSKRDHGKDQEPALSMSRHQSSNSLHLQRPPSVDPGEPNIDNVSAGRDTPKRSLKSLLMKQRQNISDSQTETSPPANIDTSQTTDNQHNGMNHEEDANPPDNPEQRSPSRAEPQKNANSRPPTRLAELVKSIKHDPSKVTAMSEDRPQSQWRRDLTVEQPVGLGSMSSLGTVVKAAMVFSKGARKQALSSMVDENNADLRQAIRKERLRVLQSRASLLNKIMLQFPVGREGS